MSEQENAQKRSVKVAKVVDSSTVILNAGTNDGIRMGQRFLIYNIGEDIVDPDTKQNLGKLETVRGTGTVTHLQPTLATVKSDMKESIPRRIVRRPSSIFYNIYGTEEEIEAQASPIAFDSPKVGDIAKPI